MVEGQIVQCACGFRFCFSCHHEAHAPATCEQVRQWGRKCSDDSETGHWLGANTKGCPRCNVFVEKNGGCNHMTCRQCGYEWCWMCTKMWKGHEDFYACARYEKAQKKKERKKGKKLTKIQAVEAEREAKRIALERYMTYYDKFLEYDNLIKHSNLREKAQARTQSLASEQTILAELKFIEKATNTISECLETIRYSHVYGYFLEDGSTEKAIFLILQEELIKTTMALKEILESPSLLQRRTEAVDLTKLAQKKKENMMKGTGEEN
jgi:ariadne-1